MATESSQEQETLTINSSPQIPPSQPKERKQKRHITADQRKLNTKFSNELINKCMPSKRLQRFLHRAGVPSASQKPISKKGLTVNDIIRIGLAARNAVLLLDTVQYRQCNLASNPEKNPTGVVIESNKSYKLRFKDSMAACDRRKSPVYWDEIIYESRKSNGKKKNKIKPNPKEVSWKETGDDVKEDSNELDLQVPSASSKKKKMVKKSKKQLLAVSSVVDNLDDDSEMSQAV